MKFGRQLLRHQVHGWGSFYVDYNGLKASLKEFTSGPPDSPRKLKLNEAWIQEVEANITRVNDFFTAVTNEVEGRVDAAFDELDTIKDEKIDAHLEQHLIPTVQHLQATLLNLSHFSAANYTALYKIFKKHDKQTGLEVMTEALQQIAEEPFHGPGRRRLEELQLRLKDLATKVGIDSSLLQLMSSHEEEAAYSWDLARVSFSLGVICTAMAVLAVLSHMEPQNDDYDIDALASTMPVFRLLFMANLSVWLAGGCACIFEHYKVNYLFLLDISPEMEVSGMSLLNFASVQSGIWIVLFFFFLADVKFGAVLLTSSSRLALPSDQLSISRFYAFTLVVVQCAASLWVCPRHLAMFLAVCVSTLLAPFSPVSFAENIFADFLTSAGRPLKDLAYTGCYLSHVNSWDPLELRRRCRHPIGFEQAGLRVMLAMPLLIRMVQCLRRMYDTGRIRPHVYNFLKYVSAFLVSVLAAADLSLIGFTEDQAHYIRTAGYLLAMVYGATWDLVMDFGVFNSARSALYPPAWYWATAVVNVALRSTWSLTYLPDFRAFVKGSSLNSETFSFVIGTLELLRRAVWAVVRLEHEHLTNNGKFRSVCWVPPLEAAREERRRRQTSSEENGSGSGFVSRLRNRVATLTGSKPTLRPRRLGLASPRSAKELRRQGSFGFSRSVSPRREQADLGITASEPAGSWARKSSPKLSAPSSTCEIVQEVEDEEMGCGSMRMTGIGSSKSEKDASPKDRSASGLQRQATKLRLMYSTPDLLSLSVEDQESTLNAAVAVANHFGRAQSVTGATSLERLLTPLTQDGGDDSPKCIRERRLKSLKKDLEKYTGPLGPV